MKSFLYITVLYLFILNNLSANDYQNWAKAQNKSYKTYTKKDKKDFAKYKKIYADVTNNYKKKIKKKWLKPEVSDTHKWVEYNKQLSSRKIVDFNKEEIKLEVIADNQKDARKRLEQLFKKLLKDDLKSAYANDVIGVQANKKLGIKYQKIENTQSIVADILTKENKQDIVNKIKKLPIKSNSYKGKLIYSVAYKLPSSAILKKALLYKKSIKSNADKEKIPEALIYAVIHSESSFNPMARSRIPAFGLMQIVPTSAGVDSYFYLYKKKKILSSSYLYKPKKNILIGTAYLHIVYYNYLKNIKNEQSRLYCTIASYNTGWGNVAKAFVGANDKKRATALINKMDEKAVYNRLINYLPYDETKRYLKKVYKRMQMYQKIIN